MDEKSLVLGLLRLAMRETPANSDCAAALTAWCHNNAADLALPAPPEATADAAPAPSWWRRRRKAATPNQPTPAEAWAQLGHDIAHAAAAIPAAATPLLALTARLAAMLALDRQETTLLQYVVAAERLRLTGALCGLLRKHRIDPLALMIELANIESIETLRRAQVVQLGLLELSATREGQVSLDATNCLHRVLNRPQCNDEAMIACLVGIALPAQLTPEDFVNHRRPFSLMCRMLRGALVESVRGVNILLYGPPGTGKTELAKTLAAAAGARLYAVGETDEYGDEPARWERVTALKLAQQVLAGRRDAVLLFDEMEDLIGDMLRAEGGRHFSRRSGSKVYVNRLFEDNAVPTIWTSNAIENIDPAFLRRMSYVLRMDLPSPRAREAILGRIARDEGVKLSPATLERLAGSATEATAVARNALRSTRLLQGGEAEAGQVLEALVSGMRNGRRAARVGREARALDLGLYESATPIAELFERLSAAGAPADFSLLMTGPPGTGKTALAHHLARQLDRPLLVKRASDLLSKWIGETEQQIAAAFAEAIEAGAVLLFDEIDSLLFDRNHAERTWEISQVNELLTWMDHHPLPFVAATNHATRLDGAALRRFDFKVKLAPLGPAAAARAFKVFFARPAPPRLAEVAGLTPGDFAVVARQLRFQQQPASGDVIVGLLEREAAAKPGLPGRIGFRPAPGAEVD
ncbi:MAG: AAA family ATPase [Kiloniellaceae bacterium]